MSSDKTRDAWASFIRMRCEELLGGPRMHAGSGSDERAAQLQAADLELEVLKESETIVKQTRNRLIPIGALPAEVLALIFALAQDSWEPEGRLASSFEASKPEGDKSPHPLGPRYHLGWIFLTHVCHRWRQVGLETAHLWQRLPCLDIPPWFASEIVCRSRQLPLELRVDDCGYEGRSTRSVMRGWLSPSILRRTSEFRVDGVFSQDFATWRMLLVHPMPTLRKLALRLHEAEDDLRLLPGAFQSGCPLLTTVSLTDCFPHWNTHPVFSSPITRLSLTTAWIDEDSEFLPDNADFRAVLASMPTLEELVLINFYPRSPDGGFRPDPFILSERFQRLTVEISCDSTAYEHMNTNFWASFIFPSTAAIEFNVDLGELDGLDSDRWHVLDPFIQLHDRDSDPQELLLDMHHIIMLYTEYNSSRTRRDYRLIPTQSSRKVRAHTSIPLCLQHLRLAHLGSIRFTSSVQYHYEAPDAWIQAYSVAFRVHCVSISLSQALPLIGALTRTNLAGGMSLFPQMRTLIINQCPGKHENIGTYRLELDMSLMDLVNVRAGAGAAIQEILVPEEMSDWLIWPHIGETTPVSFYEYT